MKSIVLLEANEIPFRVIDYFAAQAPHSALARVLARSAQFTTVCEDEIELDPWISWPTLHRGVNDTLHGILHLGQLLDRADERYPPLWRILAKAGISAGVFGSIHSNQIPEDVARYAFYLPDFFDDGVFAHPKSLLPFQRFNLGMTRRSARNVDTKIPGNLLIDFLQSAPHLGLSLDTAAAIGRQLLDERREPRLRLRRRSLQALLMGDVFLSLLKKRRPQFATFYTNHVAASMHRYWAAAFPGDYDPNPMPENWRRNYGAEILEAMQTFDKFLEKLVAQLRARGDTILMIASSMGQRAVRHQPSAGGYKITDLAKFMAALGVAPDEFRKRPAMSPCSAVVLDPARIVEVKARLDRIEINGKRFVESRNEVYPLSYGIYENSVITFFTYFENYKGAKTARIGNREMSFDELGFGFFQHEDGVAVSAHHDPEGILIVYDPSAPAPDARRREISTTEIAPAILEHFGVSVPAYMRPPARLLRGALEREMAG